MPAKSLQITRFGGPEVLKVVELSRATQLEPDQVRVRVGAAGVNFADLMMRMGLYPEAPKPPFVPGYEVAGTVLETGSAVKSVRAGDRVLGGTPFGGYTSEIILPESFVRKTPAKLSDTEAAAIPVNFMTAWVALEEMGRVRKGDRVLVQSAAGGVGVAAVQIAARRGAEVTGLIGSPGKADAVKALGASRVITEEQWQGADDREFGEFDIVLDATGGDSLKRNFRRLAPGGRVINFGISSIVGGQKRSLFRAASTMLKTPLYTPFKLMMNNKGVFGLNMLQIFEAKESPLLARSLDEVLKVFTEGQFKVIVGKTFPLAEGGAAHSYLQSRANIGKVVLTCTD